ncbi:MAG: bifunctional hydroxymethylpyrimidine kinase/phosphomethylpyrimidine kinase [Lachnospiraceae bacterium]
MYKALTIAGSDTSGGAGLQADLKTFQELDVYGMSAITVLVAQNPAAGWRHDLYPVTLDALDAQIETALSGIGVDALKTGMLPTLETIELVASKIRHYAPANVLIDPVMVCKGTNEAVNPQAADGLRRLLLPLADVVTPNLFEASQLSGLPALTSLEDMKQAATLIFQQGARNVLIKGGTKIHPSAAVDLLFDGSEFTLFEAPKVETSYTHGAGCTTAAAFTGYLARGCSVRESAAAARDFISAALRGSFYLNDYVGAVRHSACRNTFLKRA